MTRYVSVLGWASLALGCASAAPRDPGVRAPAGRARADEPALRSCARIGSAPLPRPTGPRGASSTVALASAGGERVAYVADEDSRALHTVDLAARRAVATTPLGGAPSAVLVLDDGRVAVSLRDANRVVVLEPGARAAPLAVRCDAPVPVEPVALALAGDRLLVTSGWAHRLTALDLERLAVAYGVDTAREPRAIVVAADGRRAFVSHVVGGRLSVVDLDARHAVRAVGLGVRFSPVPPEKKEASRRAGCQGFALAAAVRGEDERVYAPMVTVEPGGESPRRGSGYYGPPEPPPHLTAIPKESPLVAVVAARDEQQVTTDVASLGDHLGGECLLPRAAAVRGATDALLVTCLGVDQVLELDARGKDPARLERRRIAVPAGPTGLAIDEARGEAVVWSQFDPALTVIALDAPAPPVTIRVPYAPVGMSAEFAVGRLLFHRSGDLSITNDGVACASCHPEGRDDAITWTTPEGPRQTIALAGRAEGSAPYGWPGQQRTLDDYITNTVRRLGGFGLKPPELQALVTFVRQVRHAATRDAPETALVARGRAVFESKHQGCSACHLGGAGTDGVTHDVGSARSTDTKRDFDTPSLRFVAGSAPYFHDGRYPTLDALLRSRDHRMGHAADLDDADRRALVAYLESL